MCDRPCVLDFPREANKSCEQPQVLQFLDFPRREGVAGQRVEPQRDRVGPHPELETIKGGYAGQRPVFFHLWPLRPSAHPLLSGHWWSPYLHLNTPEQYLGR